MDILDHLESVIAQRRTASPDESYVAKLHARGLPVIARKLGEEGVEAAVALLSGDDQELIGEAADLSYPCERIGGGPEALREIIGKDGGERDLPKVVIVGQGALARADGCRTTWCPLCSCNCPRCPSCLLSGDRRRGDL